MQYRLNNKPEDHINAYNSQDQFTIKLYDDQSHLNNNKFMYKCFFLLSEDIEKGNDMHMVFQ